MQLRLGQKAFYACDFQQAESTFTTLLENTQNRYIRIATLYYLAYLSQYNIEKQAHTNYLSAMDQELRQDFPHKKDMMLFRFLLEADNGFYHSFVKQLHIDTSQNYHPTSFRSLKVLSLYLLGNGNFTQYSQLRFETFELDCLQMEEEGNYLAAQKLHYLLVEIYQMQLNTAKMRFHLQRGLTIALEQNLFLTPAIDYFYYSAVTKEVLSGFPSDFSRKLQKLGTEIHERYVRFAKKQTEVSYLSALSDKEYAFVTYAVQGYSSKRVAKELNISEKTVSYRYHQIYEKLGIDSKAELVKLIQESQSGSINTR